MADIRSSKLQCFLDQRRTHCQPRSIGLGGAIGFADASAFFRANMRNKP
jgi:hypothetical protein